ncbi:MAG: glycosyl transferase family 1 [Ignavibacteriaceae bacterium]|nr:glycosyl transferase family 1 [Ignavibacteriaceae bacterium]
MHKVLVIAYYFPPMGLSGVQRTLKFVKYLKRYEWEPTVITTENVAYFAHDESLQKELDETSVRVIRVAGSEPNSLLSKQGTIKLPSEFIRKTFNRLSQTFFIPDNKISWAKKAFQKATEILSNEHFDCVFISGPPFSQFDVFSDIKKSKNISLILDYRDLWVDNQFSFYLSPFHKIIHKRKEYKSLKAADRVIVTNRRIKEKLINDYKFLTFDEVFIISHGFDPEDFTNVELIQKPNDKMLITYAGLFYEYITPKYFLHAFKKLLIENPSVAENIRLSFVGLVGKENQRLIRELKLEAYISEYGYVNHSGTIQKLLMSDILWIMVGKGKSAETISSGKLYEYFGTRKPIIACLPDGALKTAASEYKASFITEPDNIEQIKNTIMHVYQLYKSGNLPTPDEKYVEGFRRDLLTEQLALQFNKVLKV